MENNMVVFHPPNQIIKTMTEKVKKLWGESINDEVFLREMEEADDNWIYPSLSWNELEKICFAAMYWGWKVGKSNN